MHMDMDFKWAGTGDIVLNIGFMGSKLPVQVAQLDYTTLTAVFYISILVMKRSI